jgi:nucleoside-diphosphate-sugar epimerase
VSREVCLVTGAAGFIGAHLVERLLTDGHTVIGLDSFTDFYPRGIKERNLAKVADHCRFAFFEGDILNVDLTGLLRGELVSRRWPSSPNSVGQADSAPVNVVFHLAAQAGVRDSWGQNFEVYVRNNILATQRLLEAARSASLDRFVIASSSSIYGDAEALPTVEDVTPQPVSPYGVTKLAAENLAWLYWRSYGVPIVGLRYFTVYGPRQRPDMAFHKFIRAMLEDRELLVFGDGEQTRDFTFVQDTVDATVRAGLGGSSGTVMNVGGGSRVSVNQVVNILEGIVGRKARVKYIGVRAGDVRHTSADITRISALGYVPQVTIENGLRAEVDWLASDLS